MLIDKVTERINMNFIVITCAKCDKEWPRAEEKTQEAKRPIPADTCSCGASKDCMIKRNIGI